MLYSCENWPTRSPPLETYWMFRSQVTWNATVLLIFNQAFYKLFLLTPQADSHILGGYLIPSLTFLHSEGPQNRQKTRK